MPLVIVTGLSGSGKTSALAALADCGFESVDNPPLRLTNGIVDAYADAAVPIAGVAIGLDERSLGFSTEALADSVRSLRGHAAFDCHLLFLDCSDETLLRRFNETRRRHPKAEKDSIAEALRLERAAMDPIREQADFAIDTSDLSLTDLRGELQDRFAAAEASGMTLSLLSFGFKRGAPREADIVLDVRFLANPYWLPELRELTGLDPRVRAYVTGSPGYAVAYERFRDLLLTLLPQYRNERKSYLTVAIGCTGGKHRSVTFVEALARELVAAGYAPHTRHRDLKTSVSGRMQVDAVRMRS